MSIPTSNLSIVLTQQLGIVLEKALLSPMLNESEKLTITAEMGAGYATPLTLRRIHQIYGNDFNALEACRGSKLVYLNRTEPKKVCLPFYCDQHQCR